MTTTQRPLLLITNDDGIASPGLRAAAEAVAPLGDLLIVAPHHQQTGAGRSFRPITDQRIYRHTLNIAGRPVTAYSIKGTPAQVVNAAFLDLADRPVALTISGINFGENIGSGITISGTVGAALESAAHSVPALAISLETPLEYHNSHSADVDFSAAAHFTRLFARKALSLCPFPPDVDVIKIDVPATATPATPWRVTTVSRQSYHYGIPASPEKRGRVLETGYISRIDPDVLEPDSDIWAVCIDRVVSVSPISLNLTSRIQLSMLAERLDGDGSNAHL